MKKTILLIALIVFAYSTSTATKGCPVPGVEVTATNVETKKSYKTKTKKNGKYSFNKLPAGNYVLTVSYKGQSMSVGEKGKDQLVISSPKDAASGMASGKRQHKPVTITKEIDKASPLLAKAMTDHYVRKKPGRTRKSSAQDYNSSRSNTDGVAGDYLDEDSDNDGLSDERRKRTARRKKTSRAAGNGIDNDCDGISDSSRPVLQIVLKNNKVHGHVTVLK